MTERISPREFEDAAGLEDWREVGTGGCACFRTGSFAAGARLVEAIAGAAAEVGHEPEVDLQPTTVTVRVLTRGGSPMLTGADVELARRVSEAARSLGCAAAPEELQTVQLTLDASVSDAVRPFWRAVLGYVDMGDEDVVDPRRRGPGIWFQPMGVPRTERNRFHVDVFVPHEQAEARVAAAVAAGGHVVADRGPDHWTLADAEGNEVDVATTYHRD